MKPRVLTVVRPAEGGIRAHVLKLVKFLRDQFTFSVACPQEYAAGFMEAGCEVVPVAISGKLHPYQDIQAARQIYSVVRNGEFALVHAHGFKAALLARPIARWGRTPCLVTVHGDLAHAGSSPCGRVFRAAERSLAQWATGYVTVSHWLASLMINDFGVPREKIAVIPNGVEYTEHQRPADSLVHFGGKHVLVGTVARLAPQKGIDCFIRAAGQLANNYPDVGFVIVGDGPMRRELEQLCRKLRITESVFFTGYRSDVPALLKQFDIFVQPSRSEGQGITALEAMAAGCPVVASDTGGLRELVRNGETGLLVAPGHVHGLAEAVARLLHDKDLCNRLTSRAKAEAQSYDQEKMIRETCNVYRRVVEGRWPA